MLDEWYDDYCMRIGNVILLHAQAELVVLYEDCVMCCMDECDKLLSKHDCCMFDVSMIIICMSG